MLTIVYIYQGSYYIHSDNILHPRKFKMPDFIIRFFYLRKYLYIRLDGWKGSVAVGSPLVRLKPDYWITNIL